MATNAKTTVTSATTNVTTEQDALPSLNNFVFKWPSPKLVKDNGQSSIEWTAKAIDVDPPEDARNVEANLSRFFTKVFKDSDLISRSSSKTFLRALETPRTEHDLNRASRGLGLFFSAFCKTYIDDYHDVILQAGHGCYTGRYKFGEDEDDNVLHAEDGDEVGAAQQLQS